MGWLVGRGVGGGKFCRWKVILGEEKREMGRGKCAGFNAKCEWKTRGDEREDRKTGNCVNHTIVRRN